MNNVFLVLASITIFIALSINVFVQLGIILPLLSQYDLFVGSTIK